MSMCASAKVCMYWRIRGACTDDVVCVCGCSSVRGRVHCLPGGS